MNDRKGAFLREVQLAAGATVLVGLLWLFGNLAAVERPVADMALRVPSPRTTRVSPLVVVAIDDDSVFRIGPLPWSRSRIAELIRTIRAAGADGVVVDMLLSEPADGDEALGKALDQGPSILAATLDANGRWILPLARFGGADRAGHAHAEISSDGVIRSFSAFKQSSGLSLEALSLRAARLAGWKGSMAVGTVFRPDFRLHPTDVPTYSAARLLDTAESQPDLRAKVVFLGVTATGATDQFITPVSPGHRPTPGVLVHASAAASVLDGGLLRPVGMWWAVLGAFLAALAVQRLRTLAGRLRPDHLVAVALALVTATLVALWSWLIVLPLVGLLLAAGLSAVSREVFESRAVQAETGAILHSLVAETPAGLSSPRSARDRLHLAKRLQDEVIADRNLRRTLLDGLDEGVILWDAAGCPLLANPPFDLLWPVRPTLPEMLGDGTGGVPTDLQSTSTFEIERGSHILEVRLLPIGGPVLAVVRDRTAERELDRKRRDMQRLVSHELKTPLASLAGFGSMLERYTMNDDELRQTAGLIRTEAERLGDMVRTFLDLERLETGRWENPPEVLDLAAVVRDRVRVLRAARVGGADLEVTGDESARVKAVPELLTRIVDNLIGNAIKYTPTEGSIAVTIKRGGGSVTFAVADTGPGIPPESLPHLFERFYRVPGADGQGSGLGLALVREIAQSHGAMVDVSSEVGRGSTFTVIFPAFPTGDAQ